MPSDIAEITLPAALEQARAEAAESGLPYAGGVTPPTAWELVRTGQALLVDVRTGEERAFVGRVPEGVHVPWAGFTQVFNVLEGFEGEIDALQQRGHGDGWRFHHLPWVQD